MKKKKPNYKLRRNIAKIILILIILTPIILINKTKIMNLPIYINNMQYSKVIDSLFEIKYTKEEVQDTLEYLKKHKKINDNTNSYILKLDSKGYNKKSVDYLIRNLNKTQMTEFLAKKYNKDYEDLIKNDLFKYENFERYLTYQKKHEKLSIDDIVWRIELNMDKSYYDDSDFVKNPDAITVLVNKYYELPEDYEPSDLVDMTDDYANNRYGQKKLRKEAYEQFVKMVDDAKKDNIKFYAESAYRSREFQDTLYKNYVYTNGKEEALKYAAKAGYSEHQTGLAVDLANIWTITTKGEEYAWLSKHAHKYGFIFRYKKEWEDVTGYAEESWHVRYVGEKIATDIVNKNMSYEEYYIKFIANKKTK